MSEANSVLTWRSGNGWLVLSGGPDSLSEIRAQALTRMTLVGGAAYISLDDDDDDVLEDLGELGGPTGYLVNVLLEDDDTIRARLKEAGLVLLPDNVDPEVLRSALMGAAVEAILDAFERGAGGGAGAGLARPAAGLPPLRRRAKGGGYGPRASGLLAGSPARRTACPADPGRCAGRAGSAGRLDPDRPAGRGGARALRHGAAQRGLAFRDGLCGDRRGPGAAGRHRRPGDRHLGLGAQRSGLVRHSGLFHHHDRASAGAGGAGHACRADRAGARPHRPVAAAFRGPAGPGGRGADRQSRHPAGRDVRGLHPDPRPEPDERRHRVDVRQVASNTGRSTRTRPRRFLACNSRSSRTWRTRPPACASC